ncbi:hypothetical protein ABIB99_008692 [Bradyrhizobium sp. LA6.1]|uniref:HEAT repeat domain-containing protein n=1 Tax=Bradyrhizobium sp. LA6.1 TaxID=3156378 RepID=UPI003398C796
MAAKKQTPGNVISPSKVNRRTAASGGLPARSRRKTGNPGFIGYQYQIEVTIWVALDLMLAKGATDCVEIEPRSDEDLEAAVTDPSTASLGLTAQGSQLNLILQAKTRSSSPWAAPAIADILLGQDPDNNSKGQKRSRPLAMLESDPTRRYVFVSNEASVGGLRPHEGTNLLDFPEVDELPPHAREGFDAAEQASLAPRILLLTGVTREVLASRISTLLTQHGHVPFPKHEHCLRDLCDAVRERIEGAHEGRWQVSDVLTVLTQHGGSRAPTRDMDHYIRPRSFDKVRNRLEDSHAVVIVGPSGTGKTLTADILELELRCGSPVFDVVGEEYGPGHVRQHLTRTDPVLFHLRDPWGGNRLMPGADRWSGELPKLLDQAGPGRKFLITSRSDVLLSAGHDLMKELQPYLVSIDVEDYGAARLAEIYDAIATDLSGHAKQLAVHHRPRALKELSRPYEVKRFLVALSREDCQKVRNIDDILADSQIEAISKVIAEQILPLGAEGAMAAAIIWAMLSSRAAVAREAFAKLGRRLRTCDPSLRPDVDGLIDFLVAGQNLRKDGTALAFYHPRVEDGLRRALLRYPRESERALSTTVDALLAWDRDEEDWGIETGLSILREAKRIENLQLELSAATAVRLDRHLEEVALSAKKRMDYERALRDLEQFGSKEHLPAQLAKILLQGGPDEEFSFLKRWRAPPSLRDADISALRNDPRTQPMIKRFIREVLPFARRNYHVEMIPLLERLATDLEDAFWDGLKAVAEPGDPHEGINILAAGALAGTSPDYERAIDHFARSESEADTWMKGFADDYYQAQEHAVDADAADHIIDVPSERFLNAREGMKAVVRIRRASQGVDWIATSPHRKLLLYALGDLICSTPKTPPLEELKLLLESSDDWARDQAWRAAEQHWNHSLNDYLVNELIRSDLNANERQRLVKIAAADSGTNDPVPVLISLVPRAPITRRLEFLQDVFSTRLEGDPRGADGTVARRARADRLLQSLNADERELGQSLLHMVAGGEISTVATGLSQSVRTLLGSALANASIELSGTLICLAAGAGLTIETAADRMLSTDDEKDGLIAIQVMLIGDVTDRRDKFAKAMKHRRYPVRRRALELLATDATMEERLALVAAADDHSADVRLAFAELMEAHCWPEAIEPLVELVRDTRNFSSSLNRSSWSKFSVARAAARALGSYKTLPASAVDALLQVALEDGDDPFVACATLSALATKDDPRIAPMMVTALSSTGLDASPAHRPRAQAAAWAHFDRSLSGRSDALVDAAAKVAETDGPTVAGPLLMAFGVCPEQARQDLLKRLVALREHDRQAVLRTAAIAADTPAGLSLDDREQILLRVTRGEPIEALSDIDRGSVEAWSRALDVGSEFGRFLAWIATVAFKLPVDGELDDPRALDLPETIGVMTMRSFSPFREDNGGRPDDGT